MTPGAANPKQSSQETQTDETARQKDIKDFHLVDEVFEGGHIPQNDPDANLDQDPDANVNQEPDTNVNDSEDPGAYVNQDPGAYVNQDPDANVNQEPKASVDINQDPDGNVYPDSDGNVNPNREANVDQDFGANVNQEPKASVDINQDPDANVNPDSDGNVHPNPEANVAQDFGANVNFNQDPDANVYPDSDGNVNKALEANVNPNPEARHPKDDVASPYEAALTLPVQVGVGVALGCTAGYMDSKYVEPFGILLGGSLLLMQVLDHEDFCSFLWNDQSQKNHSAHIGRKDNQDNNLSHFGEELEEFAEKNVVIAGCFTGGYLLGYRLA